ncbi:C45 family autoproteolytic acyltransferase/hydolase [Billgrantia gudaonensis]|uniref:Predicted choloylglycine hydrolase n=1 Tax=Billgrantia gudaonensis TaxID=376427 RepID=A0A1G8W4U8_9GAMM|nr:C45 family peptidase [Halomonas gudaonensis]SDJ73328.1 Predicted choloylglycine hydrolase [Halomonas gudaonensis]
MPKTLLFRTVHEAAPGPKWRGLFDLHWPAYEAWYLAEGERERPGYLACYNALRHHMPELVDTYRTLCELAGGGDLAARLLSLYRPPPYITGCSQAVLARPGATVLARNYDYPPELCEGTILYTRWNDRGVIAMSDCLWGVLDGMNDQGLAVSLAFGGRRVVGDGFGAPILLRYLLQCCTTVPEAAEALARLPTHMAYNITVADAAGRYVTAMIAPDQRATIRRVPVATNHQKRIEWYAHALASETLIRERQLSILVDEETTSETRLVASLLAPPLFRHDYPRGLGTVYTSVYRPDLGEVGFRWPEASLELSFAHFPETQVMVHYGTGAQAAR